MLICTIPPLSLRNQAFAKVTLQGRLVDAPTTFESKNGTIFARYTVAVDNRSTYSKEESEYDPFSVYRALSSLWILPNLGAGRHIQ